MNESYSRRASLRRKSRETEVLVALDLDPDAPSADVDCGIGFLDHMLTALAVHAGWKLILLCRGDLAVDDHHSAEDCAIALGEALAIALSSKAGPAIRRFGSAYAPLDEALARAVIDLSGRAFCRAELGLSGAALGGLAGENVQHFFWSFASSAKMTLHVDVLEGYNAHHKAEAAFKALALALREASSAREPSSRANRGDAAEAAGDAGHAGGGAASTKGSVMLEELGEAEWERMAARLKGTKNG
jgi:imidazoleglycerol-phosphate dehydratase